MTSTTRSASARQSFAACRAASIARRIVLVTPESRRDCRLKHSGFTGYLVKPVRAVFACGAVQTRARTIRGTPPGGQSSIVGRLSCGNSTRKAFGPGGGRQRNQCAARPSAAGSRLGHRPTVAANGDAALEAWRAARADDAPYDLVLMDLHMPGIRRPEATQRIRAAETRTGAAHTPHHCAHRQCVQRRPRRHV